jgi:hypothetical protein
MATAVSRPIAIVFSKDRPFQLDAALRSLRAHCVDVDRLIVDVLWRGSTTSFERGYRVLAAEHRHVTFDRQGEFKSDVLRLTSHATHIMFVVDDAIFVRDFSVGDAIAVLDRNQACLGVSLRLGRNTTFSYTADRPQALPAFEPIGDGFLDWDWTRASANFHYPLEVSSSLYRALDIRPLLMDLDYHNPNTLERRLARSAILLAEQHPRLACFESSRAFSIPANVVQRSIKRNRSSADPATSPAALMRRFRSGERLDLGRYSGMVPGAAHQVVAFEYEYSIRRGLVRLVRWELSWPIAHWHRVVRGIRKLRRRYGRSSRV